MGQSTPIPKSAAGTCAFLVGQDAQGHWLVRDASGMSGGLFADKRAALHYAVFESNREPQAVMLVPEHIKYTLAGSLPVLVNPCR